MPDSGAQPQGPMQPETTVATSGSATASPPAPPPAQSSINPVREFGRYGGTPSFGGLLPTSKFKFGASLITLHDDNIFTKPHGKVQDWLVQFSPYVELAWGDFEEKYDSYAIVRYEAEARHYIENDYLDKVDSLLQLDVQKRFKKAVLDFDFHFKSLSTYDVDFGQRTERQIIDGTLTSIYEVSDKTSVETDFSGTHTDYQQGLDSDEEYANLWWNVQLLPKFRFGAGVTAGLLEQQGSSAQQYYQFNLRANFYTTQKFTIRGEVGAEYRNFEGRGKGNVLGRFGFLYKPWPNTQISLDFNRNIEAASSQAGRNFLSSGFVARIDEFLFQRRVDLTLSGGYLNDDYNVSSFEPGASRIDNVFFVTPRITFQLSNSLHLAFFYTCQENHSTLQNISFKDNVYGLELTAEY